MGWAPFLGVVSAIHRTPIGEDEVVRIPTGAFYPGVMVGLTPSQAFALPSFGPVPVQSAWQRAGTFLFCAQRNLAFRILAGLVPS